MQKTLVVAGLSLVAGASFAMASADTSDQYNPVPQQRSEDMYPVHVAPTVEREAPKVEPTPEAPRPAPVAEKPKGKAFNCRISAYYSPVRGQRRYATGSYAGDIRLNGRGTNGASGRQVFPGMIAAPKHLAFGTKIDVPGYGIGEVQDRGGAIKGNRLDLYFGKGEAALNAALKFGVRNTTCTIL